MTPLPIAILAGGLATRLRPLTETIPKALVEINGEPFLAHQMRLLRSAGIDRVVLLLGYRGEMIQDYLGDGSAFGLHADYVFDGPELLGTAGAIRQALPALGDAFGVVYGDSYLPCDYRGIEQFFLASGRQGLMTVFHNLGKYDTSNVEFEGGRILVYDKKNRTARMQHIDYGLGYFRRPAFERIPAAGPYDLASLYQELLREGELAAFEVPQRFYEIGSFEGIAELSALIASKE